MSRRAQPQPASPPVVLFTQRGCPDSARVRAWLAEHGVPFVERDVTTDREAVRALLATGHFGTPLTLIGQQTVAGFRPDAIDTALTRPVDG